MPDIGVACSLSIMEFTGLSAITASKEKLRCPVGHVAKMAERVRVHLGPQTGSLPWLQHGLTLARFLPSFNTSSSASHWPPYSGAQDLLCPNCCLPPPFPGAADFLPGSRPGLVVWISSLCVLLGWIWRKESQRAQQDIHLAPRSCPSFTAS